MTEIIEIPRGNPVIVMMELMQMGMDFEVCECPRIEKRWYFNEDGEYVRDDG